MARRSRAGTSIKKSWDVKRLGRALAAQGIDLRHWVSYGTVASVSGEDGTANYTDANAIVISPAGIDVDVILEPSKYPVTCRYGIQAGQVFIGTPIHPGDQVVVMIPDGDVSMIPEIVKIIPGSSDPIPVGDDGMPIFKNDAALVFAKGVPIDLRTDGGGWLRVTADGKQLLGGPDAAEQLLLGTTYRSKEGAMNQSLTVALTTLTTAATAMTPGDIAIITALATTVGAFLAAFKVFSPLWLQALQQFEASSGQYLSNVSKTKQ